MADIQEAIEDAVGQIKYRTDKAVAQRKQFIRDILDDFQARKVDLEKACVGIDNCVLEIIDTVIADLRGNPILQSKASQKSAPVAQPAKVATLPNHKAVAVTPNSDAKSPAARAAAIFNTNTVATKSQEQLTLDDFEIN